MSQQTERRATDQTRAWADQVEKLGWLYKLTGTTSAEFIGPRIEDDLNAEYEKIRPVVEQLRAVVDADGPVMVNDIDAGG
ncbi:MAG TPA: hypothetical protein VM529_25910 [Gemmata sp.]|nr:hypothetical protein [Gemmata sp.]